MTPARLFSLVAGFLCAATWAAPDGDPPELRKLREVYFGQIQKVQEKYLADLAAAPEAQTQALTELEKTFQRAGDLKSLLAVREERARFGQNPDPAAIQVVEKPRQLATLQEDYVRACRERERLRAQTILELARKYAQSLGTLQKELTQQGRIEDALRVMKEIEQIKDSEPVRTAQSQLSGEAQPAGAPVAAPRSAALDVAALRQFVHGEIVSWNSVTGELTCRYDFATPEQFLDWEGATVDDVRQRLVCSEKPARFLLPFKSVSKLQYAGYLYDGNNGIRVSAGGLSAEIGYGPEQSKLVLFQDNEHYPLAQFERDIEKYVKYEAELSIRDTQVEWSLNGRLLSAVTLPRPLPAPLYVVLGRDGNRTMFDDVVVTGIINPTALLGAGK